MDVSPDHYTEKNCEHIDGEKKYHDKTKFHQYLTTNSGLWNMLEKIQC